MSNNFILILLFLVCMSCSVSASDGIKEKDYPGHEYMPDMYRSFAYDAYSVNPNFSDSMNARQPVKGTIPRGFMPFEYENTLEDFNRAGEELINPLDSNDKNLQDGKALYGMFCAHCHGQNGDGKGSITHPVYGAVPSYSDDIILRPRSKTTMKDLTDGHIYHTIFHGYNAMGPHYSLVTSEERWKIVLYVNELKNVEK